MTVGVLSCNIYFSTVDFQMLKVGHQEMKKVAGKKRKKYTKSVNYIHIGKLLRTHVNELNKNNKTRTGPYAKVAKILHKKNVDKEIHHLYTIWINNRGGVRDRDSDSREMSLNSIAIPKDLDMDINELKYCDHSNFDHAESITKHSNIVVAKPISMQKGMSEVTDRLRPENTSRKSEIVEDVERIVIQQGRSRKRKRFSDNWLSCDSTKISRYCVCNKHWEHVDNGFMVECSVCLRWFHMSCLKLPRVTGCFKDENITFTCGQSNCTSSLIFVIKYDDTPDEMAMSSHSTLNVTKSVRTLIADNSNKNDSELIDMARSDSDVALLQNIDIVKSESDIGVQHNIDMARSESDVMVQHNIDVAKSESHVAVQNKIDVAKSESHVAVQHNIDMARSESDVTVQHNIDIAKSESHVAVQNKIDVAKSDSHVAVQHNIDMTRSESDVTVKEDNGDVWSCESNIKQSSDVNFLDVEDIEDILQVKIPHNHFEYTVQPAASFALSPADWDLLRRTQKKDVLGLVFGSLFS